MVKPKRILRLHITVHASRPERSLSFSHLSGTLENIINRAFQLRFPEYEVDIEYLEAPDWPEDEYPTLDRREKKK